MGPPASSPDEALEASGLRTRREGSRERDDRKRHMSLSTLHVCKVSTSLIKQQGKMKF